MTIGQEGIPKGWREHNHLSRIICHFTLVILKDLKMDKMELLLKISGCLILRSLGLNSQLQKSASAPNTKKTCSLLRGHTYNKDGA